MKKHKYFLETLTFITVLLFIFSCQTQPTTIPDNLSPAEYFQRAQDASENENYRLALKYYEKFQKKYPDNLEKNLWASYEIAFLHHKMGDDKTAIELFDKLIDKYNSKDASKWPQAPKILAEKVKAKILEKQKGKSE